MSKQKRKVFRVNPDKWFVPTPRVLERLTKENFFDYKLYEYVLKKLISMLQARQQLYLSLKL
jgi:hypothetical protein